MNRHPRMPVIAGALSAAGLMLAARAVPPCCVTQGSWQGTTPCSGQATTWCEEASDESGSGRNWTTGPRLAQCHKYSLSTGSYFVQALCDNPPPFCTRVGPPLDPAGNYCCYVYGTIVETVFDREFGIWPCGDLPCPG